MVQYLYMDIPRAEVLKFVTDLLEVIVAFMLRIKNTPSQVTKAHLLATTSKDYIGKDASPEDEAPDELGCAESVSKIINRVVPFPTEVSTIKLQKRLETSKYFERVWGREVVGDVMVSPTGSGDGLKTGHTWIYMGEGKWASNSSYTGTWEVNYTTETIKKLWNINHKMPLYIYRLVV